MDEIIESLGDDFFDAIDENSGEDFFAQPDEDDTPSGNDDEPIDKPIGNKTVTKGKNESEEDKKKTKIEDFFAETDDKDDDLDEDDIDEDDKSISGTEGLPEMAVFNFLKEKGLIEVKDDVKVTEENVSDYVEDALDSIYDEKIDSMFENLPPLLKQINKFVIQGGNIESFLNKVSLQNNSGLASDMDLKDEKNLIKIAEHKLREEGYDDEYITSHIEFLKDSQNLEKYSSKHYADWIEKKNEERQKELLVIQQQKENERKERREMKQELIESLKTTPNSTVGGFAISTQDLRILPSYMTDKTVKFDNGKEVTPMNKDLMKVLRSKVGSIQLAKLLRTADESGQLNFDEFIESVRSKSVQSIKDDLTNKNKKSFKRKAGSVRNLADYY